MISVHQIDIKSLSLINRGKVRDIYDIDKDYMLIVTTDRLSAFDVILPDPIPEKGVILTAVSNFWFERTENIIQNHLSDKSLKGILSYDECSTIEGRSIVVNKLKPLPVEAIVRGYLIGSGWDDYQKTGGVCGIVLPEGLKQAQQLPEIIYTPSSKAKVGSHDENINFEKTVSLLGKTIAEQIRDVSIKLYREAAAYALERGIIIADTKFEFGTDKNGELVLIDEILTPDSSRFWPANSYEVGKSPPSFDKQYVRDYLETLDWDKTEPGPNLPDEVIQCTVDKYREAMNLLMDNRTLND